MAMGERHMKTWQWLGLAIALSACATSMPVQSAYDQARANLAECASKVGFNPQGNFDAFDRSLAPNEAAYWACAHEGVERYVLPATRIPNQYRSLIADNRRWLASLGSGEMTRQQWRARLDQRIDQVKDQERALYKSEQM